MEKIKTQTEEQKKNFKTTNQTFAFTDRKFNEVCNRLGIKPTPRQASKWRNGEGIAWKNREKVD